MLKRIARTLVFVTVICCISIMIACEDKTEEIADVKTEEIMNLIDNGDFSDAYDYYIKKIDGKAKESDICNEVTERLEERYETITDKCFLGELDEKDIESLCNLLNDMSVDEAVYKDYSLDWEKAFLSKRNYENALEYIKDEDYESALLCLEEVDSRDSDYDDAMAKIEETDILIFEGVADEIENWINASSYDDIDVAFKVIEGKAYEYSDNEAVAERIDELYAMAEDALTEHIHQLLEESRYADARIVLVNLYPPVSDETYNKLFSQIEAEVVLSVKRFIEAEFSEYDFASAEVYLNGYVLMYPEFRELQILYDGLEESYVKRVTNDVENLISTGDLQKAAEILEISVGDSGVGFENEKLSKLYNEYSLPSDDKAEVIEGLYVGMSEDEMKNAVIAYHNAFQVGTADFVYNSSMDKEVKVYTFAFDNGFSEFDSTMTSYLSVEIIEGHVINIALHFGVKASGNENNVYSYNEAELAAEYERLYTILAEKFGESVQTDVSQFPEDIGYRAYNDWIDTECADIWFVYGINLWGKDSGINEIILSFSNSELYN